jgi:hypothetical protein
MMSVLGFTLFFAGLAVLAAVPLRIILNASDRRVPVKDVTVRSHD